MSHNALYYPFHLCHAETLHRLMDRYAAVHFRDYMALQIGPLVGTTAYEDRIGDQFPDHVRNGRIVQGHHVSGPLDSSMVSAIDRDLVDGAWRRQFHTALTQDRRFQRGLLGSHSPLLATLIQPAWSCTSYSIHRIRALAMHLTAYQDDAEYEYGIALLKTSASLHYTIRLAHTHHLVAATDSLPHYQLLEQILHREEIDLANEWIRTGRSGTTEGTLGTLEAPS